MGMKKVTPAELQARRDAEQARRERREALESEIKNTMPPQSLPGLADRIAKVEELLGLRDLDV